MNGIGFEIRARTPVPKLNKKNCHREWRVFYSIIAVKHIFATLNQRQCCFNVVCLLDEGF